MATNNILVKGQFREKLFFVFACLFFILAILINLLPFLDASNALMDFGSFYASGLKARSGENPYDPNSEYIFEINFSRVGAGGKMINLNPPISVPVFAYLSQFDPHRLLIIWQIVSAVLYGGLVLLLSTSYRESITPVRFIWAFTLAGFWHTVVLGQIYIVLLLCTALGWIFLQKGKYILAGIAIGLAIAIKPNFLIWAVFLLISGYSVSAFVSILSSLVLSLLPILFYGARIYQQWLEASALHIGTLTMPGNNSLLGLTARFHSIPAGIMLSVIAVVALLILSRGKPPEEMGRPEYVSTLGIIASLLASPISWTGYTILLLPVFFSIKKWSWPVVASAALLSVPFAIVLQLFQRSFATYIVFGWFYGWAILCLLTVLVRNTMMRRTMPTH
jgi:hypothetical protein